MLTARFPDIVTGTVMAWAPPRTTIEPPAPVPKVSVAPPTEPGESV